MKTSRDGAKLVLGLGTHVLKAQETIVIPFEAEMAFRPEKLVFPPGIGEEFSVIQISIDKPRNGDTCATLEADPTPSPGSRFGRTIGIRWKGQSGSMNPSKGIHKGEVTIRNNSDHEALFKGGLLGPVMDGETVAQKNDDQKDGDEGNLSLLERAKRWYTDGFRQAVEDFRGGRPAPESREEITAARWHEDSTIAGMLRSLLARVIWYARLPLDAAYFLMDQMEVGEADPDEPALEDLVTVHDRSIRRPDGDGRQDDYIVGFGRTSISPESTQNISSQAQTKFKPERLVIPPDAAPGFLIVDVKVGPNSQLFSTGAIPAVLFGEPAGRAAKMRLDVCEEGEYITITVINTRSTPLDFTAAILGPRIG